MPDFTQLLIPSPEPLAGIEPTVMWYSATGFQPSDTFFLHGGFFSPVTQAQASVGSSIITTAKAGTDFTVTLRVANTGSGPANNILMNQVSTQTLGGSGTAAYTGPPLPLSVGNLPVGTSTDVALTFSLIGTVNKFALTLPVTFQDSSGNTYNYTSCR